MANAEQSEKKPSQPSQHSGAEDAFRDELGSMSSPAARTKPASTSAGDSAGKTPGATNEKACHWRGEYNAVLDFVTGSVYTNKPVTEAAQKKLQSGYDCKDDSREGAVDAANAAIRKLLPKDIFTGATTDKDVFARLTDDQPTAVVPGVELSTPARDSFAKPAPLTVGSVKEGTQAYMAGLRAGDRIVSVDGQDTTQGPFVMRAESLQGKPNSLTQIEVERTDPKTGKIESQQMWLKRDGSEKSPVSASRMEGDIWRIKIDDFASKKTAEEFAKTIEQIRSSNPPPRGIVLDLRNNAGGYVEQGINVVEQLLDKGNVFLAAKRDADKPRSTEVNNLALSLTPSREVMQSENAKGNSPREESTAVRKYTPQIDVPVGVLVNGHSASTAEVVAAALRDRKSPDLIVGGETTYGKGNILDIQKLPSSTVVEVEVGKMYAPGNGGDPLKTLREHKGETFGDSNTFRPGVKPAVFIPGKPGVVLGSSDDTQLNRMRELVDARARAR